MWQVRARCFWRRCGGKGRYGRGEVYPEFFSTVLTLHLRLRGRKNSCDNFRLEPALTVGGVAERLILALAAAAKRNPRPSREVELVPVNIVQLKVPFDLYTAVALNDDFCGHG